MSFNSGVETVMPFQMTSQTTFPLISAGARTGVALARAQGLECT